MTLAQRGPPGLCLVASPTRQTHTDFEDRLEDVTEPEFEREKVVEIRLTANAAETGENIIRTQ